MLRSWTSPAASAWPMLMSPHTVADLPICMAKTPRSLSDDPARRGRPRDFVVTVNDVRISAGTGFLVPITGSILTMPGLP